MMKAVILDAATLGEDIDLDPIRALVDELRVYPATGPDQLDSHLGDAELVITNKTVITGRAMAGRRGILVLATGTNNIDIKAAEEQGIPVLNVENYGTDSVAQHTWMLILALAARLPLYQRKVRGGAWQRSPSFSLMDFPVLGLAGKSLVIVGAGHLGMAVAGLARAFGMRVIFSARPGKRDDPRPALDDLLDRADVISFHCPLTDATRHLLNAERLRFLKPGCLVVNCARGGIIDEEAALASLRSGGIGGLAVDVLPEEPPGRGHPLLDALADDLNLIVTPHNAWISAEARQKVVDLTADNIRRLRRS